MSQEIYEIVTSLGYQLTSDKDGWRTTANYRGGDNKTALKIFSDGSGFIDFAANRRGSFEELIQLSLGLKTIDDARVWLQNKNVCLCDNQIVSHVKLSLPKIYSPDFIQLDKDHSYWVNRGIDLRVLEEFDGGVCNTGRLKNRYVNVIYNGKKQIVGYCGRTLVNDDKKYKILGEKKNFGYPLYLNHQYIKESKSIILVESVGCVFSLFTCGIRNCVCLFGLDLNLVVLNAMLRLGVEKIVIATNNEDSGRGLDAALKISKKLCRFFDTHQIVISLPPDKDFNSALIKFGRNKILQWYDRIK